MDPLTLMLLQVGIQSVPGIISLFSKNKVPAELQEYYDLVKSRAQFGIGGAYQQILSGATGAIGRQAGAMQQRGASALASRGVSSGSSADEMITGVNQTAGETYASVVDSLNRLNEQVKSMALGEYGGAAATVAGIKQKQGQTAWENILGGANTLGAFFQNKEDNQQLQNIINQVTASIDRQTKSYENSRISPDALIKQVMAQFGLGDPLTAQNNESLIPILQMLLGQNQAILPQ